MHETCIPDECGKIVQKTKNFGTVSLRDMVTLTHELLWSTFDNPLDLWEKWSAILEKMRFNFDWESPFGQHLLCTFLHRVEERFSAFHDAVLLQLDVVNDPLDVVYDPLELVHMFRYKWEPLRASASEQSALTLEAVTHGVAARGKKRKLFGPLVVSCFRCGKPGHWARLCYTVIPKTAL